MLAGVTIVDPADDLDRGGRRDRARRDIHPFTVLRGATRVAPAPRSARTRSWSTPRSARARSSGRSATCAPAPCSEPARRRARSSRSRTHASARARRCRISRTSATPRSARARTSPPGNITANYPHEPGRPKGRTVIGRNVRTGVQNVFVAPVEIGDDAWIGAGSTITEDVPPGRSRSRGRGRSTKRAMSERSDGGNEMTEATLPGLETLDSPRCPDDRRSAGSSARRRRG